MINENDKKLIINKFKNFDISDEDIEIMANSATCLKFSPGLVLYKDKNSCYGFIIVKNGALRAFILSQNAKEITIFSLSKGDECMLCSTCTSENLQIEINLEAKENLQILVIPPNIFSSMRQKYPKLANFALELISKRFAQSINVMGEALFAPLSSRLKQYLISNSQDGVIQKTHEEIANDLGSAREVISRMLKEMEKLSEIKLERGKIILF